VVSSRALCRRWECMSWCVLGPVRSHISTMSKPRESHAAARTASTGSDGWVSPRLDSFSSYLDFVC